MYIFIRMEVEATVKGTFRVHETPGFWGVLPMGTFLQGTQFSGPQQ